MELQQRIESELKNAIREKDETRRTAIRMLLTAMKNKEKELRRPPDDTEIQQIISSQVKQRKDSVEQYLKGGRKDLAEKEEAEILVLQAFLPEQLPLDALEKLVDETVQEVGAHSVQDVGKVMKAVMPKVAGKADGKQVNELVRRRLQGG